MLPSGAGAAEVGQHLSIDLQGSELRSQLARPPRCAPSPDPRHHLACTAVQGASMAARRTRTLTTGTGTQVGGPA